MTNWATHFRYAEDLRKRAEAERDAAMARRCNWYHPDGGWPCTADAEPEHEHRHDAADLPDAQPLPAKPGSTPQ